MSMKLEFEKHGELEKAYGGCCLLSVGIEGQRC
jgi:hypothetical protein